MMTNLQLLIKSFNTAKELDMRFVGFLVQIEGYPKRELIINERENFDEKVKYIINTYDDDLVNKHVDTISIVGVAYGHSLEIIQWELLD